MAVKNRVARRREGDTMSAWVEQPASRVKKHGKAIASWCCQCDQPDRTRRVKSCGPDKGGKKAAERMRDRIKAEPLTGTYNRQAAKTWNEFKRLPMAPEHVRRIE